MIAFENRWSEVALCETHWGGGASAGHLLTATVPMKQESSGGSLHSPHEFLRR